MNCFEAALTRAGMATVMGPMGPLALYTHPDAEATILAVTASMVAIHLVIQTLDDLSECLSRNGFSDLADRVDRHKAGLARDSTFIREVEWTGLNS
jgi:hypothetical protein